MLALLGSRRQNVAVVAAGLVSLLFFGFPIAAHAAEDAEVAETIVELSVDFLDINISDSGLLDALVEDMEYALSEDILAADISAAVSAAIDTGEEPVVDELRLTQLASQEDRWNEESSILAGAFEQVRQAFESCRSENTGSAKECARQIAPDMQAASLQVNAQRAEEIRESMQNLTGDELDEALERLAKAEGRLADKIGRVELKVQERQRAGVETGSLLDALADAQERTQGRVDQGVVGNKTNTPARTKGQADDDRPPNQGNGGPNGGNDSSNRGSPGQDSGTSGGQAGSTPEAPEPSPEEDSAPGKSGENNGNSGGNGKGGGRENSNGQDR